MFRSCNYVIGSKLQSTFLLHKLCQGEFRIKSSEKKCWQHQKWWWHYHYCYINEVSFFPKVELRFRGCLQVKFHPEMKLIPGWNYPCLWWNVSYCLHVFAEMKFHPGMNPSRHERQGWDFIPGWKKKKKKRRVNSSSRDEILKWACF